MKLQKYSNPPVEEAHHCRLNTILATHQAPQESARAHRVAAKAHAAVHVHAATAPATAAASWTNLDLQTAVATPGQLRLQQTHVPTQAQHSRPQSKQVSFTAMKTYWFLTQTIQGSKLSMFRLLRMQHPVCHRKLFRTDFSLLSSFQRLSRVLPIRSDHCRTQSTVLRSRQGTRTDFWHRSGRGNRSKRISSLASWTFRSCKGPHSQHAQWGGSVWRPRRPEFQLLHNSAIGRSWSRGGDSGVVSASCSCEGEWRECLVKQLWVRKAAAENLERSPFDMLAPGIIYETAAWLLGKSKRTAQHKLAATEVSWGQCGSFGGTSASRGKEEAKRMSLCALYDSTSKWCNRRNAASAVLPLCRLRFLLQESYPAWNRANRKISTGS